MFFIALEYPQLSASPCAAAPQVRKVIPTNHPALTQPRMNTPPENSASAYHNHFPNHTVIGSWHPLLRLRARSSEMQRRIRVSERAYANCASSPIGSRSDVPLLSYATLG